jgi:large repetitive protein
MDQIINSIQILSKLSRPLFSKVVTLLLFFVLANSVLAATKNVVYDGKVCQGGVLTLNEVLKNTTPKIPGGHQTNGVWRAITPGITISNFNDPYAVASGFNAVGIYQIEWRDNSGSIYVISLTVTAAASIPNPTLTYNGSTADVLICSKTTIPLDGAPNGLNFRYFVKNSTSGINNLVYSGTGIPANSGNYTLGVANYEPLDKVFVVATDNNGCQNTSNSILISTVDDIAVKVVGGASICRGVGFTGEVLEVTPFNNTGGFSYVWTTPTGPVPNVSTVNASNIGDYYVTVTSTTPGCLGNWQSNIASVRAYELPSVSISPIGPIAICGNGGSALLTASLSSAPISPIDYTWTNNGFYQTTSAPNTMVTSSSLNVTGLGNYKAVIREVGNEECWRESNNIEVNAKEILGFISANGPVTFCASTTFNPQININVSGGTAPYRAVINGVTYNNLSEGNNAIIISAGINTTTTYTIQQVSDATNCEADLVVVPPASLTFTAEAPVGVRNITGSDVCAGTNANIGVSGGQNGVTYILRHLAGGVLTDIETITRTADGDFVFVTKPNTAGTYYVVGRNALCGEVTMNGTVTIKTIPLAENMSGPMGTLCDGANYIFGLTASEPGVTYFLYRGATQVDFKVGDLLGGSIFFNAQSAMGTYTVRANNGVCAEVLMNGSFSILKSPNIYNVTGGTGCSDIGVNVGLSGAEAGVTYSLFRDGALVTTRLNDGAFGLQTQAGTYTVSASLNGCVTSMVGNAIVNQVPANVPFSSTVTTCPNGTITLPAPTQTGIRYELFRNGVATGSSIVSGGGVVNFGMQVIPGEYSVRAVNPLTGCSAILTDRLVIQGEPNILALQATATTYCNTNPLSGITIFVENSQVGAFYQLLRNGVNYGGIVIGTGGRLEWPNVLAGSYTLTAQNDGGCIISMVGNPIVTAAPPPTALVSAQMPNRRCSNQVMNFKLTVSLTGIPPFNFQVIDNKGSAPINVVGHPTSVFTLDVNPASSTTYTLVNITDAANCIAVDANTSAQFFVDDVPDITFTPSDPQACYGSLIMITAQGAGPGGSYLWSSGLGTSQSINVSPASTTSYTVTATTVNGCTSSKSVTVNVNQLPVVDFSTPGNDYVYCSNEPQVILTGSPAGGTFSNLPGSSGIIAGSNIFDPSLAQIGNNYVVYTYSDVTGCTNTITKNIIVNRIPTVNLLDLAAFYCASTGALTLRGTPQNSNGDFSLIGYGEPTPFYNDNHNGTAWFSPSGALSSGSGPGVYQFRYTYTDGNTGCTNFIERSTTVHPDFNTAISFTGLPANPCQGDASSYLLTGSEAPYGTFSGNGVVDNGDGTATFTPSAAGNGTHTIVYNYTMPVTNCSGSTSQTITVGTNLSINLNAIYCQTDLPITLSGNPGGGTFTIRNSSNVVLSSGPDGTVVFNPQVLPSGVYDVEYQYVTGAGTPGECINTRSWSVNIVTTPNASFSTISGLTQFCSTAGLVQLVPLQVGGNFTGPVVSGNFFNPALAGPGIHNITYTINTGSCSASTSINLSVIAPDNIWINNLNDAYCDNNTAAILIEANNKNMAGANYTFSSTTNAIGLSPIYYIDGLGNRVYANSIVGEEVYFDPARVGDGFYTVTYTFDNSANNGCTSSYSKIVRVHPALGVNFGGIADPLQYCRDAGLVTLQGSFIGSGVFTGTGAFTGNGITDINPLDGIAIFNPSAVAIGAHAITYTYTSPVAEGSCVSIKTKNIEVLDVPIAYNVTPLPSTPHVGHYCEGGTGVVLGVEFSQVGVTYRLIQNGNLVSPVQIKAGDGNDIQFDLPVTSQGVYTVQAVNDLTGCTNFMIGSVTVVINKVAASIIVQDVSCKSGADGTITIQASSSPGESLPYEFSINGGATWSASSVFNGLSHGTYLVDVRDNIGCTIPADIPVVIGEPLADLAISVVANTPVGCTPCVNNVSCEGSATISISGGTTFTDVITYPDGYIIEWRDALNNVIGNSKTISGRAPGVYTVSVTDAQGCTTFSTATIVELSPLSIVKDPNPVSHINNICNNGLIGQFRVIASGGSGQYQFSLDNVNWFNEVNDADNAYVFETLKAGNYVVYLRDKNNTRCVVQLANDVTITEPTAIMPTLVSITDVTCFGDSNGSLQVSASGGASGIYAYSIDGVDFSNVSGVFGSLPNGTYQVLVRDSYNCYATNLAPIHIAQPAQLIATSILVNNVSCFGGSNGAVSVTTNGGNPPFNYEWTLSGDATIISTSATATGLSSGSYVVRVIDSKGCSVVSSPVFVGQPLVPLSFNIINVQDVACDCTLTGLCEGSASVQIISGNSPYSVVWSNGATGITNSGLSNGLYSVTVTDANGCELTKTVNIGILQPIVVTENLANHIDVSCFGGNNGQFVVSAIGGSGVYEFSLDGANWFANGLSSFTFNNLLAGSYNVWVRDFNYKRCVYTIANPVAISQPSQLNLIELLAGHKDVDCYNASNGVVELLASGGSGLFEYSIDGGTNWQVSNVFAGLNASTYGFWVRDQIAPACVFYGMPTVNVAQPLPLDFTYSLSNVTCHGANDGGITITASGGNAGSQFAYSIDNGVSWQLSNSFNGLAPASYMIKVRDNQSGIICESAGTMVTIGQPSQINVAVLAGSLVNVDCYGESTGQFTLSPMPVGASLEYSINGGLTWQASPTFSGLAAGSYNVSIRQGGCSRINVLLVTITEPLAGLTISNVNISNVSCSSNSTTGNVANGTISVSVTGGTLPYNFQWFNNLNGNPVSVSNGGDTHTVTGLTSGAYRVEIMDASGSCFTSAVYNIGEPAVWNVLSSSTNVSLAGGNDGAITITTIEGGIAPYSILWADGVVYNNLSARNNLVAGNYTFTIVDGIGCTYTRNVTIYEDEALDVNYNGFDVKCYGNATGQISILISNGKPTYNLYWEAALVSGGTISGSANNIGAVYQLNNLLAGTYNLRVTDNGGLGAVSEAVIVIQQPVSPVSVTSSYTNVVCIGENNGTISLTIAGGTPDAGGDYTIALTPGYTIAGSSYQFTNLAPGPYIVNVVDNEGCASSANFVISQPQPLDIVFTKGDVNCSGASNGFANATVTGRGGGAPFRYDWYRMVGPNENPFLLNGPSTINNLSAGTYLLKVESLADGCKVERFVTIEEGLPLAMTAVVTDITSCFGDANGKINLTVSGGKTPYTLVYGNGITSNTLVGNGPFEMNNLPAGTYSLRVDDASGCFINQSGLVITQPTLLNVTDITHSIDCANNQSGTLSFNLSGGRSIMGNQQYYIELQGPSGYANVQNVSHLTGAVYNASYVSLAYGDYRLIVRDALSTNPINCAFEYLFKLEELSINAIVTPSTCAGIDNGQITNVSIQGASPGYSWAWSTANGIGLDYSTLSQSGLSAGTYTLSIFDAIRGCTINKNFVITNQFTPLIDASVTDVSCAGASNGAIINVNVTGATPAISYLWSGPSIVSAGLQQQTQLSGGTYQLDVTDANGCKATRLFTVNEPVAISYDLSSTLDACDPHSRSIFVNNLTGGTAPLGGYTFYWQGPGQTYATQNLSNITIGGEYRVTVRDEKLCQTVKSINVSGAITMVPTVIHPVCAGGNNGSIAIAISGGSGLYHYQWAKDGVAYSNSKDISALTAGRYVLLVTDLGETFGGSACNQSITIDIVEPLPLIVSESVTHLTCAGNSTEGAINLSVNGGVAPYVYNWSSANGTGLINGVEDQSGLSGGTYSVSVTDANGCTINKSIQINEPQPLTFSLGVVQTNCNGTNGSINITSVTGGNGGYEYTWGGPGLLPTNKTTMFVGNLIHGEYTIAVRDVKGCETIHKTVLYQPLNATYTTQAQTCGNMPDGAIDVVVTGGMMPYSYVWSTVDGGNLVQGVASQTGLPTGNYQVVVTDARNCSSTLLINVARQSQIQVLGTAYPVLCFGQNTGRIDVSVSGGSGNYSFNWSGTGVGLITNAQSQVNIGKGAYTLVVRDNVSGCEETRQFTVNGPDAPLSVSNITTASIQCKGESTGSIEVLATGGSPNYKYLWNGPGTFIPGPVQNNLPAGNYSVIVEDANGCQVSSNVISLTEPIQQLQASVLNVTHVTQFGDATGAIQVAVSGGTGAYLLSWTGTDYLGNAISIANNNYNPSALLAGIYALSVTDDNGCTTSISNIVVRQPGGLLTLNVTHKDVRPCFGENSGEISAIVTGGDSPYTIRWYNGAGTLLGSALQNAVVISNLTAGVYRVEAEDANGVKKSQIITIEQPAPLQLFVSVPQHVDCYNEATGQLQVLVMGGIPSGVNYKLVVLGDSYYNESVAVIGNNNYTYSNLRSGNYLVQLIDDSSSDGAFSPVDDCSKQVSVTINQPQAHVAIDGNQTICVNQTATLRFITSGWNNINVNPLSVTLSNGSVLQVNDSPFLYTYTPLASELVEIQSVNVAGCNKGTFSGSAAVIVNSRPTARLTGEGEICTGQSQRLRFDLTGSAPWRLVYNNGVADIVVNNIMSSPYFVDVTPLISTTYALKSVDDIFCATSYDENDALNQVKVTVHPLPQVTISGNNTICSGVSSNIVFEFNSGTAPWQVTIDVNGVEQTIPNILTTPYTWSVAPDNSTVYTLKRVFDSHNCEQTAIGSVLVTVNPLPVNPLPINGLLHVCQGKTMFSLAYPVCYMLMFMTGRFLLILQLLVVQAPILYW